MINCDYRTFFVCSTGIFALNFQSHEFVWDMNLETEKPSVARVQKKQLGIGTNKKMFGNLAKSDAANELQSDHSLSAINIISKP